MTKRERLIVKFIVANIVVDLLFLVSLVWMLVAIGAQKPSAIAPDALPSVTMPVSAPVPTASISIDDTKSSVVKEQSPTPQQSIQHSVNLWPNETIIPLSTPTGTKVVN